MLATLIGVGGGGGGISSEISKLKNEPSQPSAKLPSGPSELSPKSMMSPVANVLSTVLLLKSACPPVMRTWTGIDVFLSTPDEEVLILLHMEELP